MKRFLIILIIGAATTAATAQSTELEKTLQNALFNCRLNFYELAENYIKLDSTYKAENTQLRNEAAAAAQARENERKRAELAEKKAKKRKRQRNAATASTLILIILNLLNR